MFNNDLKGLFQTSCCPCFFEKEATKLIPVPKEHLPKFAELS